MGNKTIFAVVFFVFLFSHPVSGQVNRCNIGPFFGKAACLAEWDVTDPLGSRIPLIIIHGWNPESTLSARPKLDLWEPFIEYYLTDQALMREYKIYFFVYYSNLISISALGKSFRDDLDIKNSLDSNFGSKPLLLLAHSMGGLISRSYMLERQNSGAWAGKFGGERVARLITLGTPHHGSPMANGPARNRMASNYDLVSLITFDSLFFIGQGPSHLQFNRSDLRWDNFDLLLDYSTFFNERNLFLESLNNIPVYDSKIIAYGGTFSDDSHCASFSLDRIYCYGRDIMKEAMGLISDGIVPISSALFYGQQSAPRVVNRTFSGHNHGQIVEGKNGDIYDDLFYSLRTDLLAARNAISYGISRYGPDFNGDSLGDVFAYNPNTGEWEIHYSNGQSGSFYQSGRWSPGWSVSNGDFNGDNLTDLFLYNSSSGRWFRAINNGMGDFNYFGSSWSPGWSIQVLDLNGDERSDVFLYSQTTGTWFRCVSRVNGSGEFIYKRGQWSPGWQLYPGDFGGNFIMDLFLYSPSTGQWFMAINDGYDFSYSGGQWSPGWEIYPAQFNWTYYWGDHQSDVFLYNRSSGQWFVAFNNKAGGFYYFSGQWSPGWSILTGNFRGFGDIELFLYTPTGNKWFRVSFSSDGRTGYESGVRTVTGNKMFIGGFDSDNYQDILEYNSINGNAVQWFGGQNGFTLYSTRIKPGRYIVSSRAN